MGLRNWLEAPARGVAAERPGVNLVRGALARITTPLLPDDYLHLANPLWSARELRGQILAVTKETDDTATLTIKTGWGFSSKFVPGQYVGIGVLLDGRWTWRSYSLTSVPDAGSGPRAKVITITVKAMVEGFLSTHLVGGVKPGTVVRLQAPQGDFTLPEPLPGKLLFLTAGSGITPVMSMLRTAARRGQLTGPAAADIVHIHSAPTADTALFLTELTKLTDTFDAYKFSLRQTRSAGRLDPSNMATEVPDYADRQMWACGPTSFLATIEAAWITAGLANRMHVERFAVERADVSASGGEVNFAKSGKTTDVDGATTLLEAGEAAGVQMPFGCRMGICQTCVVQLGEGQVRDLRNGSLHSEGERIQACVSVAVGDCSLEI